MALKLFKTNKREEQEGFKCSYAGIKDANVMRNDQSLPKNIFIPIHGVHFRPFYLP